MPADLRGGWDNVQRGAFAGPASQEALRAAGWLARHGPHMGSSPPTVAERSRALGVGAYMRELGLAEAAAYDAQANAFDHLMFREAGPFA